MEEYTLKEKTKDRVGWEMSNSSKQSGMWKNHLELHYTKDKKVIDFVVVRAV